MSLHHKTNNIKEPPDRYTRTTFPSPNSHQGSSVVRISWRPSVEALSSAAPSGEHASRPHLPNRQHMFCTFVNLPQKDTVFRRSSHRPDPQPKPPNFRLNPYTNTNTPESPRSNQQNHIRIMIPQDRRSESRSGITGPDSRRRSAARSRSRKRLRPKQGRERHRPHRADHRGGQSDAGQSVHPGTQDHAPVPLPPLG